MPVNGFSVGRDYAVNVQTPSGPLVFNLVTKFASKPEQTVRKIKGLDGITRNVIFPDGWTGQFEIERQDSAIDDYFAALEAAYYAGQNRAPCTITETITEANGAVSQYQYIGVNLQLDDAGAAAGDEVVKQVVSFMAQQRVKV